MIYLNALIYAAILGAFGWREHVRSRAVKALAAEIVTEKRRVEDTKAEWESKYNAAVAATFAHLLQKAHESASTDDGKIVVAEIFARLAEFQTAPVQAMLDSLRVKVQSMNAAMEDAARQTTAAAATVREVKEDNVLLRTLLDKAHSLPLDTTPEQHLFFLSRIRQALDGKPSGVTL